MTIDVRDGSPADLSLTLDLLDEAVSWLAANGSSEQWGIEPFSVGARREQISDMLASGQSRIAHVGARPVGVAIWKSGPTDYVAAAEVPELYLHLLVTARSHAGTGIGRILVEDGASMARAAGAFQLRVDCFDGGGRRLAAAYRRLGFVRERSLAVERPGQRPWPGCVMVRVIQDRTAGH